MDRPFKTKRALAYQSDLFFRGGLWGDGLGPSGCLLFCALKTIKKKVNVTGLNSKQEVAALYVNDDHRTSSM